MEFNLSIKFDINGYFQITIEDESQNYISPELSYEQIYTINLYLAMKLYEYEKLSKQNN